MRKSIADRDTSGDPHEYAFGATAWGRTARRVSRIDDAAFSRTPTPRSFASFIMMNTPDPTTNVLNSLSQLDLAPSLASLPPTFVRSLDIGRLGRIREGAAFIGDFAGPRRRRGVAWPPSSFRSH